MKITAIIPAAGTGSRYSRTKNKLLENLNGLPVIVNTLQVISSVQEINDIIICTSIDLIDEIRNITQIYKLNKVKDVILGGKTRQESVFIGLKFINTNPDYVIIHDGARPLIDKEIIHNSISTAQKNGAAIVAVPVKDTIKKVNNHTKQVIDTLNREELWNIQTPQIFNYAEILAGHIKYKDENFTDDSGIIEKMGLPVHIVMGSYKNIKITTQEDLQIAEILSNKKL